MLRRDFFRSLASLAASLVAPDLFARMSAVDTVLRFAAPANVPPAGSPTDNAARAVADQSQTALLQRSPVAGFQFHRGEDVWPALAIGAPLILIREPENRFDPLAIRVEWNRQKIGYVPRAENEIAAGLMDRGELLTASIVALAVADNPWERVGMEIGVVV